MRLSEAYSILEISENTSPADVKKKYKELSKKYHPDVNKDPGAEDKFKKINEAYSRIQKGEDDIEQGSMSGFDPFEHFSNFNPFFQQSQQRAKQVNHVVIELNISFAESILGTKKEISFNRLTKCSSCNGQGQIAINNGCTKCGGKGQITNQQGNMIFVQTCNKCMGRLKNQACNPCNSSGVLDTVSTVSVNIPGGVIDKNILRLAGMGNFAGQFMSMDQFSDVHLILNVSQDPNLRLENSFVIYNLKISLLEALKGCKKTVPTVNGEQDIDIKPLSKNCDEITIPNMGINRTGDQKVILEVTYPDDTIKLINALSQTEEM